MMHNGIKHQSINQLINRSTKPINQPTIHSFIISFSQSISYS